MLRARISFIFIVLACICLAAGCGPKKQAQGENAVWKDTGAQAQLDPWLLVSEALPRGDEAGTYLGNGFYGVRLFSTGFGRLGDTPAESRCYGFYDGAEKILNLPQLADLRFYDESGEELKQTGKGFRQTLDMKQACLITEGEWKSSRMAAEIRSAVYVLKSRFSYCCCAIELEVKPYKNGRITVKAPVSPGDGPGRTAGPDGKWPVRQWADAEHNGDGAAYMPFKENAPFEFWFDARKNKTKKLVYYADNVAALDARSESAPFGAGEKISFSGWVDSMIKQHKALWAETWKADIVIEGDPEAQQTVHSDMFYLLESAGHAFGIPPTGLSSNGFGGHIFWDTELWMVPALIWQRPDAVRDILSYRIQRLPAALELGKEYTGKDGCAAFPWESAASGKEVTPPGVVTKDERHISSDIVFAMWQYYKATGDKEFLAECWDSIRCVANFWTEFAEKNGSGGYDIKNVCPPDENAGLVDNSVYTNASAQASLFIASLASGVLGHSPDPRWTEVAKGLAVPDDGEKLVIYDGYKGGKIKQADPELLYYPWHYQDLQSVFPSAKTFAKLAEATCDYYMKRTEENGPAMSASAHSIITAKLKKDPEEALRLFRESYRPFMRGPFNYFNEKRSATYKNWCFLTGAAGSASAALWGFAGLDMDYYSPEVKHTVKPCVPGEWKSVTLTGVHFGGKVCNITARADGSYEIK